MMHDACGRYTTVKWCRHTTDVRTGYSSTRTYPVPDTVYGRSRGDSKEEHLHLSDAVLESVLESVLIMNYYGILSLTI